MSTPEHHDETQEQKIQRLLARMEAEDVHARGKTLDAQRAAWQKKPGLRYVIGPFMAGQLFDLWQWTLGRVDTFLWGWAQDASHAPVKNTQKQDDPRAALRDALNKKSPKP